MIKFVHKIFFLLFILIFSHSCSNEKKNIEVKKSIPLNILYKDAFDIYVKGNPSRALEIFERVEKDYSYSIWASKALLMRSYIYYENMDYVKSLTNLQKFKQRYAGSANIIYAEYLIAMCLFEQIRDISLSQQNTELALKQFQKIINTYPRTDYAIDSKFKIDLIHEQLAGKNMYLARYYMKRQKWMAAIYRLNLILENYQKTVFVEEALHRLVEIYYKIGNIELAKKYASILGYNYNDNDWYKKSYKIIERDQNKILNNKNNISLKDRLKDLVNF